MTRFWIIRIIWWAVFGVCLWFYWQPTITILVVLYGIRADLQDAIELRRERGYEDLNRRFSELLKGNRRGQ